MMYCCSSVKRIVFHSRARAYCVCPRRYDGMFAQRVERVQFQSEDHDHTAVFRGDQSESFGAFGSQVRRENVRRRRLRRRRRRTSVLFVCLFLKSTRLPFLFRVFIPTSDRPGVCVFRIPELPMKVAGDVMMRGILREKRIFSIPEHIMYLTALVR